MFCVTETNNKFGKNQGTDFEKGDVPIKHTGRMQLGKISFSEIGVYLHKTGTEQAVQ